MSSIVFKIVFLALKRFIDKKVSKSNRLKKYFKLIKKKSIYTGSTKKKKKYSSVN